MANFRKKPVVIEAFQFIGWTGATSYMPSWFMKEGDPVPADGVDWRSHGAGIYNAARHPDPQIACFIKTLEGEMRADIGDWIIKGIKGEIYPCKNDIFVATYETIAPAASLATSNVAPSTDGAIDISALESVRMVDLSSPAGVSVEISHNGKTVWVNVDGICRLRAQNVGSVGVLDRRPLL